MSFWEFIKSKVFGKKEALPEAQIVPQTALYMGNNRNSVSEFDNNIKVNYTPQPQQSNYMPDINSIEFAIQQYLYGIQKQYNEGRTFNSYTVLTSICGMDTSNSGNNLQNELEFLKKIDKDRKAIVINQPSANGGVCFRHVQKGRNLGNTDRRLYINCKRENIAELAEKFYEEFGNNPYYFKFCTDEQADSKRRSEQFVFYVSSEPHELNRTIQTIKRTKQKYPKLFEGSKNMNPFMKNVDGFIGYAPDVSDGIYYSLDGYSTPIAKSYNSLLGEALSDSFTYAIKDVVAQDYELTKKTNGEIYERAYPYIREVLEDVLEDPDKQRKLIEKMKVNLEKCTVRNPLLSIKGLEQDRVK